MRAEQATASEERRLFVLRSSERSADYGHWLLLARLLDGFARLDVKTQAVGSLSRPPYKPPIKERWRADIEAVLASATIRPALSVADFLRDHGLALDLGGLHARHFGIRLVASLTPPVSLREAWLGGDGYLAMEGPPERIPFRWSEEVPQAERDAFVENEIALTGAGRGPWRRWRENGIDWLARGEDELPGTGVFVTELTGYGRRRKVSLRSYGRSARRSAIGAALERVARSLTFLD